MACGDGFREGRATDEREGLVESNAESTNNEDDHFAAVQTLKNISNSLSSLKIV